MTTTGDSTEHPRVLFVTNMYPTEERPGYGIIVGRMAEALIRSGVQVEVVFIRGCDDVREYFRARRLVVQAVERYRPDVVHVHFGYSIVATRKDYPRVVTFYGDDLNGTSTGRGGITAKSRLGVAVSLWAALRCEKSIAVSESLRLRIPQALGRDRCVTIRDAVDTSLFSPGSRAAARERLGVSEAKRLVLFPHSAVQATKRRDLAEAGIRVAREQGHDVELWVVNGKHPQMMPDYYRAADLLLVTSDREGGPSCVKEALACGLPVVSVPVGDLRVLEEARDCCRVVDRHPLAIAQGIADILTQRDHARVNRLPVELDLAVAARRVRTVYQEAIAAFHRVPVASRTLARDGAR